MQHSGHVFGRKQGEEPNEYQRNTSAEFPYVLVPEDQPAFRDEDAEKRAAAKYWAAQRPAERSGYFLAKVEKYFDPDYGVKVHETPIRP